MKFHVVADTALGEQFTTDEPTLPEITPVGQPDSTRQLSLNEEVSSAVCVVVQEDGNIQEIPATGTGDTFEAQCTSTTPTIPFVAGPDVFGPIAALLGTSTVPVRPDAETLGRSPSPKPRFSAPPRNGTSTTSPRTPIRFTYTWSNSRSSGAR